MSTTPPESNPAEMEVIHPEVPHPITSGGSKFVNWLGVLVLVYLLLIAVGMIGSGFKWVSGGAAGAEKLFAFADNPIMGVMMGLLATALIQSSSTVTSVIVGLVAGGLPVVTAIPMIMGANLGTTLTNTLVSFGHIGSRQEFQRAYAAATIHDFFNILAVFIFLPLELMTGFLEKSSLFLSDLFLNVDNAEIGFNPVKAATKPVVSFMQHEVFGNLSESVGYPKLGGVLMILAGIGLIFVSIIYIGKLLRRLLIGKAREIFLSALGRGPAAGLTSGAVVTVLVQSSSTTTSLAVPLVGTGVINLRQVYPFTLGANIGTTVTALLAATAVTGDNSVSAMEIAFVHFLFNVFGVIVIYGLPFLRKIPIICAEHLAAKAAANKLWAVGYILVVFFMIPGLAYMIYAVE
nr:Na/Pi symporter [Ruficoccus amylovorans]